jgi:hypothetical protein
VVPPMRGLLVRCRVSVVQPRTDDKEAPMNYSLAYRIGFHPWEETMLEHDPDLESRNNQK